MASLIDPTLLASESAASCPSACVISYADEPNVVPGGHDILIAWNGDSAESACYVQTLSQVEGDPAGVLNYKCGAGEASGWCCRSNSLFESPVALCCPVSSSPMPRMPPPPPSPASAVLLYADQGCGAQASNLGTSFDTVHECLATALQTDGCGDSVMWSPYSWSWGCRCCTSYGADGGSTNNNWAVWTWHVSPPPSPPHPPPSPVTPPLPSPPPSPPAIPQLDVSACAAELVPQPAWAPLRSATPLAGSLELAQTHVVVASDETRIAPRVIAARETLAIFTPETPIGEAGPSAPVLLLTAFDGDDDSLGTLTMSPPSESIPILEQRLTDTSLEQFTTSAWHAVVPAAWMVEGHTLRIGRTSTEAAEGSSIDADAHVILEISEIFEFALVDLGAPHAFTVSRAKIALFGDAEEVAALNADTDKGAKIARDWFPTIPFAELRWVEAPPLVLDAIVVTTAEGAELVTSEGRLAEVSSRYNARDPGDHWSVLKHQFTFRLAMANLGLGLGDTSFSGQNSPFSYGTTVGQGWFRDDDGSYHDIDDAPWAAGWTGWTAMWLGTCGNGFTHELGHSMTLLHFTEGTADDWGIADEVPLPPLTSWSSQPAACGAVYPMPSPPARMPPVSACLPLDAAVHQWRRHPRGGPSVGL